MLLLAGPGGQADWRLFCGERCVVLAQVGQDCRDQDLELGEGLVGRQEGEIWRTGAVLLYCGVAEGQHNVTGVGPFCASRQANDAGFRRGSAKASGRQEGTVAEILFVLAVLLAVPSAVESTMHLIDVLRSRRQR